MTYTQVMDEISPDIGLVRRVQGNWRQLIARLAWEHSGVLIALARELEERETTFMTFQETMNQVVHCIAPECVAREAGVSAPEIRQAQLDPTDEFYLSPPPHWRQVIAQLAWERSDVLQSLARGLQREADGAVL